VKLCAVRFAPMSSLDEELQRLLASEYLDSIGQLTLDEVRSMRAESQELETAVSYLRRMVQGRLDIVHAYLDQDEDGAGGDIRTLVERLPEIMAGPERPAGPGRLPSKMSPDLERDLTEEVDAVLDAEGIAALPTMSRDQLLDLAKRLSDVEKKTSEQRRALHERIDKLQAEIVSRYKSGEATVEGLLA
jgi:hypothetical protein